MFLGITASLSILNCVGALVNSPPVISVSCYHVYYNNPQNTHLCGRILYILLRFSVSSDLYKLLGFYCVGVMDMQVQCAVVTLVISNCLKKLSCPLVSVCIEAGKPVSRNGCRRFCIWIRRCISWVDVYMSGDPCSNRFFVTTITLQSLSLCCIVLEACQVMGRDGNVR